MASAEVELDAHGFEVPTQFVSKYNAVRQSTQGLPAATVSWPALLEQAALKGYRAGGPLPPRFVAAVREGVPDEHRAAAWLLLSGAAAKRDEQPGLYATLLAAARSHSEDHEVEEQIDRDLHRTFPGHPALTPAFCQRIKNVLLAYSARNPEVAYCQGMNFVCAAILMFIEQEDAAFWMLSHVVEEVLVDHYVQSMLGHQVDQQVLEQLLEQQLPHRRRVGSAVCPVGTIAPRPPTRAVPPTAQAGRTHPPERRLGSLEACRGPPAAGPNV